MTDQKHSPRASRYPGYDVLRKRHTPSWDETTRRVVDARLAIRREPTFLDDAAWRTLDALCGRVVPQPACAVPRLRHQEWFHDHVRIERMLFDGAPTPRDGVITPDLSRPGCGLEFKHADAQRYCAH